MTEDVIPINKDVIDGSPVVHREVARLYTPNSKFADRLSPTYGVDYCKLEDGRGVFQCVHPDPPECGYWEMKGESVRSHLRVHVANKKQAEIARIKAEHDELVKRVEQRKENYRRGAQKAVATKQKNRENDEKVEAVMTPKQYNEELIRMQMVIDGCAEGVHEVTTKLDNIVKSLDKASAEINVLASKEVSSELAAKAASWDAIQGLLNPGNKG